MKAFLVANVTVKDGEKFQRYAKAAGESMQRFGGQVLTKGKAVEKLAGTGSNEHQNVALICFPDLEKLEAWFYSEPYQTIIPLREEAADMIITSYVVPD